MPPDHCQPKTANSADPPVFRWVCIVLIGLVGLQTLQNLPSANPDRIPGESRGDLILQEESLADELAGWSRLQFMPPKPADKLSDQQYWWSHSWEYGADGAKALVSFDQADWTGWHELPQCYICIGWKYADRHVESPSNVDHETWNYVSASFTKANSQGCLVLVSMFYEDGTPVIPRGTTNEKSLVGSPSLQDRLAGRLGYNPDPKESSGLRALQCQICMQYQGELSEDVVHAARELHLASREQFRQLWVKHQPTAN